MHIIEHKDHVEIVGTDMSLEHTFECGQCFRFFRQPDGAYAGVAFDRPVRLWYTPDGFAVSGSREDFDNIWKKYLDLELDYAALSADFPRDDFTQSAIAYGRGLRILSQQPWEALCSFIISQCNNIVRIQGIVRTLCRLFGEETELMGEIFYTFPTAERIASLSLDELAPLRAGYRDAYILSAARRVASGEFCFSALERLDTPAARRELLSLEGVGSKVADCFLLFGMHRLDAFPIDTWMKKAAAYYPGGLSAESFGKYAGIAQQYIFYYAKSQKIG